MIKVFLIFSLLFVCCYCVENSDLTLLDARAKKKKSSAKLLDINSRKTRAVSSSYEKDFCNKWLLSSLREAPISIGLDDGITKIPAMILLLVFSKVAIFKAVSVFLTMMIFQKMFSLGGVLFKQFMKMKTDKPATMYGTPPTQNYDTVGYSYSSPEHEPFKEGYPGSGAGSSYDWLLNKHNMK